MSGPTTADTAKPLSTNSPELLDAIRHELSDRQQEVYFHRMICEKRVSTVAAIMRISISTVEKDLKVIRAVRSRACAAAIAAKEELRTDIPVAVSHKVGFGHNATLRAVMTGADHRRISR